MMNPDYRDAIVQNLKDAGCSAGIIENFLRYFDENQREAVRIAGNSQKPTLNTDT